MKIEAASMVNARGKKVNPIPSKEWLDMRFEIIPEVNGIVWKGKKKEAGSKCLRPDGRKRDVCVGIKENGRVTLYPVHLIVWKMLGREIPEGHELNHIDGDVWNNSPSNLECVSVNQKAMMAKAISNKKSGLPKGVSIDRTSYRAMITHNGRQVSLGYFKSVDEAYKARLDAEQRIIGGLDPIDASTIKIETPEVKAERKSKPARKMPTLEYLKEALRYEPETGKFFWRDDRPRHHFSSDRGMNISNSGYGGTEAGAIRSSRGKADYIVICVGGEKYFAHRLAWMFVHGVDPGELQIDHINRDMSDNRIDNLRVVTNQLNGFNSGKRSCTQPDLPRGVQKHLNGKFEATLKFNGQTHRLGTFDSAEDASEARRIKSKELGIQIFLE